MDAPAISMPVLGFFRRIVRGYFRRHFHGVRVSAASQFRHNGTPLIVYANHSSWWDPMVSILLAERFMPQRNHYAPMDAAALARYRILRRVGIFPVEMKTAKGGVQFLRMGMTILERGGVLWVTPQGRFVDARMRPLAFKPGLAALAKRVSAASGGCTLLPLAIEYPFWDERLPEALLRFGQPVHVQTNEPAEALEARLIDGLRETMNELRDLAVGRDAGVFTTLSQGRLGVGGLYGMGKKLGAIVLRQPRREEHTVANNSSVERSKDDA